MRKRSKHGGAIKLMRSASKMKRKETTQECIECHESFRANPVQMQVWGGKCFECVCKEKS